MSRFRVEILPEAEAEFREAFLWYFERSPLAADVFRAEVFDKIDSLVDDADTWPKDESGIRLRILSRFLDVASEPRRLSHRAACEDSGERSRACLPEVAGPLH